MDEVTLLRAMRLGTRSPLEERDPSDLGRFGLGLKTASFSQCRRLTVLTRQEGAVSCARWDLDYVVANNQWLVQVPERIGTIPWAEELGGSGTLVVWEELSTTAESESATEAEFIRELDEARSHLELVFHRYLAGERGLRRISILLNDRPLEPFDPFHAAHAATIVGSEERILFEGQQVVVVAFTLPHHSKVSPLDWERYAGKEGYLKNQGFYVYRQRRLILHGTWFGLTRQTELTRLTRVRIDMPNALDTAWKIDIKKSSAQLPAPIRRRLAKIIEPLVTGSKRVYRSRGKRLLDDNPVPIWSRIQDKNEIRYRINELHPIVTDLISHLGADSHASLLHLLEVAGSALPMDAIFADIGEASNKHGNASTSDDALSYAALITYKYLRGNGNSNADTVAIMHDAEPFRSNWDRTLAIVNTTVESTDR